MSVLTNSGRRILLGSTVLMSAMSLDFGVPPIGGGGGTPPPSGQWYETLFATRNGTGVGPRVSSWTPAATWAAATSGVSNDGSVITVSGSDITATAIEFTGFKLKNNGANNIFEDCIGDVNANGQGGAAIQWDLGGLNPTVRYCRMTNPARLGGVKMMAFNYATGTITVEHNDIRDVAGQDPFKGPEPGNIIRFDGNLVKGVHLVTNAHIDTYDLRGADPGSYVRDALTIGDATAESVSSGTGTGFNNAGGRIDPSDPHNSKGNGTIWEQMIVVGHDDPAAQGNMFSIGDSTTTGVVMYDILYDLREHNGLCQPNMRVDDWYARSFDWAASLSAGEITGISAPVPFPNLASQPAAIPSTMVTPVITGGAGVIQWADNARPANQRDLITRYDLRYSTDGSSWTTVTDVSLVADELGVPASSNYRIQFRAVNGIGAAPWSPSSNLVTVAAGLTSLTLSETTTEVYDSDRFDTQFAAVGATVTHDIPNVTIQYRIFEHASPTTTVVDWSDVTLGAGSSTDITLLVPEHIPAVRAEIRGKTATGVTAVQSNRWYAGNNVVPFGQSLLDRMLKFNIPGGVSFTPPSERLWMLWNDTNGSSATGPQVVDGTSPLGLRRMAAVFAKYDAPRMTLVNGAQNSTGRDQLLDDSNTNRDWAASFANPIVKLRSLGTDVCAAVEHWFTNEAAVRLKLERHVAPGYLRQVLDGLTGTPDGSGLQPYTSGTINVGSNGYSPDHFLWDMTGGGQGIFNATRTKWVPWYGASFKNSTTVTDGNFSANDIQKADIQAALRDMVSGVAMGQVSLNSVTGWTDPAAFGGHLAMPGGTHVAVDIDGESLCAVYFAHMLLRLIGVLPRDEPRITGWSFAGDRSYVDVEISLPHGGNLSIAYIEHGAGAYAGSLEATEWVTPSVLPETSTPELHNVQGFSIVRSGNHSFKNFTATIVETGTGTGAARKGKVRLTPSVAFASGSDGFAFGYIEGYHLLSQSDVNACRPQIHMPLETRVHASGTGYGYPVIREPNTAVIATAP